MYFGFSHIMLLEVALCTQGRLNTDGVVWQTLLTPFLNSEDLHFLFQGFDILCWHHSWTVRIITSCYKGCVWSDDRTSASALLPCQLWAWACHFRPDDDESSEDTDHHFLFIMWCASRDDRLPAPLPFERMGIKEDGSSLPISVLYHLSPDGFLWSFNLLESSY